MRNFNSKTLGQKTVKDVVRLSGVGLHSGALIQLNIFPAEPYTGIVFKRSDLRTAPVIPALFKHVVNTQLATTLGIGPVTISTVEHLLAALHGLQIDNAVIEVSGSELPILDGSSEPFVSAILAVGIREQDTPKLTLMLKNKIEIKMGEKWAVAEPSKTFEVESTIEWDHPSIGYQSFKYIEGKTDFYEISDARTFGFLKDVEALKKLGLARGASLDNVIALDTVSVLNPEGLRGSNEFVRHKVLDALGDFKLAGIDILAKFKLHRSGHDLHNRILVDIFKNPNNYEIIGEIKGEALQPSWLKSVFLKSVAATF